MLLVIFETFFLGRFSTSLDGCNQRRRDRFRRKRRDNCRRDRERVHRRMKFHRCSAVSANAENSSWIHPVLTCVRAPGVQRRYSTHTHACAHARAHFSRERETEKKIHNPPFYALPARPCVHTRARVCVCVRVYMVHAHLRTRASTREYYSLERICI